MNDHCRLCGKEVGKDQWREHMISKHNSVLIKSPKNNDGSWKVDSELKLVKQSGV